MRTGGVRLVACGLAAVCSGAVRAEAARTRFEENPPAGAASAAPAPSASAGGRRARRRGARAQSGARGGEAGGGGRGARASRRPEPAGSDALRRVRERRDVASRSERSRCRASSSGRSRRSRSRGSSPASERVAQRGRRPFRDRAGAGRARPRGAGEARLRGPPRGARGPASRRRADRDLEADRGGRSGPDTRPAWGSSRTSCAPRARRRASSSSGAGTRPPRRRRSSSCGSLLVSTGRRPDSDDAPARPRRDPGCSGGGEFAEAGPRRDARAEGGRPREETVRLAADLARRNLRPDFVVSAAYMNRGSLPLDVGGAASGSRSRSGPAGSSAR